LPLVQTYLKNTDPLALKGNLDSSGKIEVIVEGDTIVLSTDDLLIRSIVQPGWAIAEHGDIKIAIDLTINDDLRAEGVARNLVRNIQEKRKQSGYNIADRIELWVDAQVGPNLKMIAQEVLAVTVHEGAPSTDLEGVIFGNGFAMRKVTLLE